MICGEIWVPMLFLRVPSFLRLCSGSCSVISQNRKKVDLSTCPTLTHFEMSRMVSGMNEEFHPDVKMVNLYYVYLALGVAVSCLSWMIPMTIAAFLLLSVNYALIVTASLFLPLVTVVFFVVYWIQRYYSSIKYVFTENEVIVEKGVYWRRKSFVPYNRITNIDILQGPLARYFDLGTVRIQTAGFSAGSSGTHTAEAVILNVKNFDELKDVIMDFVRRRKPMAVEAEAEVDVPKSLSEQILRELRRIRETLERSGK